jgi:hypothetical protein
MPRFSCPNCQKALKTSAAIPAGKKIKCPGCSHVFPLPSEEAMAISAEQPTSRSPRPASSSERPLLKRRSEVADDKADQRRSARKSRHEDDPGGDTNSHEQLSRRRSKKKSKSSSSLLLVLSGVGVLVVVLVITGFVWPGFLIGTSGKVKAVSSLPRSVQGPGPGRVAQSKGGVNVKDPANPAPQEPEPDKGGDPAPPAPVPPAKGGAARGAASASLSIRDIMVKLSRGPQALGSRIGKELMDDPPAWETLGAQTTEYADLASSIAAHEPPKGSKDSWARLTAAFADSAVALERSVESKDRSAALVAHKALENSCMACHQQHRGGPGGFGPGGPGGFGPKGFGPKGGKGPKKVLLRGRIRREAACRQVLNSLEALCVVFVRRSWAS